MNSNIDERLRWKHQHEVSQVTETIASPDTRERELAPLRMIRDNYEKTVLVGDGDNRMTEDGIIIRKLADFLLEA